MTRAKKLYGLDPQRIRDSELGAVLERELRRHTDPSSIRRRLRDLRSGHVVTGVADLPLTRLETLVAELPRVTVQNALRRRGRFGHLFEPPTAADAYLRSSDELRKLLDGPAAEELFRTVRGREVLEQHARVLFGELSDVTDRYDMLSVETGVFNGIVRRLYPDDYPSLRLDAHHVVEERAFERFSDDWKLLGWSSPTDMAALPVFYEHHIRSPKRLPGLGQLGRELDAKSLTQELLKAIHPDKAKTPFALLDAYRGFYSRGGLRRAVPVLDAIDRELARRYSLRRIIRATPRR